MKRFKILFVKNLKNTLDFLVNSWYTTQRNASLWVFAWISERQALYDWGLWTMSGRELSSIKQCTWCDTVSLSFTYLCDGEQEIPKRINVSQRLAFYFYFGGELIVSGSVQKMETKNIWWCFRSGAYNNYPCKRTEIRKNKPRISVYRLPWYR